MVGHKLPKVTRITLSFVIFFICLWGVMTGGLFVWSRVAVEPTEFNGNIELSSGQSLVEFSNLLERSQLIDSALLFRLLIKLNYSYKNFKAGKYKFQTPLTPHRIISTIVNGEIDHAMVLKILVPEGFSMSQVIARAQAHGLDKDKLWALAHDRDFLESLGVSASTLEGYFYPATYSFYNTLPSEKEFLSRGVQEFFSRLPNDYISQVKARGLTLEKAVIFASLIEKETVLSEEKNYVSEVLWNRLEKRMPLGIDASLIYGIKDYKGNIRTRHLRDRKNKYNTRCRHIMCRNCH